MESLASLSSGRSLEERLGEAVREIGIDRAERGADASVSVDTLFGLGEIARRNGEVERPDGDAPKPCLVCRQRIAVGVNGNKVPCCDRCILKPCYRLAGKMPPRNSPCFCKSGKKFKLCCRKKIV